MQSCKIIMFPHQNINKILNDEIFSLLYSYDINSINQFSIIYKYKSLINILNNGKLLIKKIKKQTLSIYKKYDTIINSCNVKESEIIINYYNIYYFDTLISKLLKYLFKFSNSLENLYTYVKKNFIISKEIFEKNENDILNIFIMIKINLLDINTKLFDIK